METLSVLKIAVIVFVILSKLIFLVVLKILISVALLLVLLIRNLLLSRKDQSLRTWAKNDLRRGISIKENILIFFYEKNILYPSTSGIFIIFTFVIVLFIIFYIFYLVGSNWIIFPNIDYSPYYQIFSAIIFGLFILLTENSKKSNNLKALLWYSYIFPILVFSVIFYASIPVLRILLEEKAYLFVVWLFSLVTSLVTLLPIYRILHAYLLPSVLTLAVKDTTNRLMEYQYIKRLVFNELDKILKEASTKKIIFEYKPFYSAEDGYEIINPYKGLVSIYDINRYELLALLKELESKVRVNITASDLPGISEGSLTTTTDPDENMVPCKFIFARTLGDALTGKDPLLLIPSNLVNLFTRQTLEKRIKRVFTCKSIDMHIDGDLMISIKETQDSAFLAIKDDLEYSLADSLKTYDSIVGSFLEGLIKLFERGYSLPDATKEMNNIFGRAWGFLYEINKSYLKILEKIVNYKAKNSYPILIDKIFSYLQLSIKYNDNYVFGMFALRLSDYYALIAVDKDAVSRKNNLNYFLLKLRETVDHFLIPTFVEIGNSDVSKFKDFAIHTLYAFNYLLKRCIDKKDSETFGRILDILAKPIERFTRRKYQNVEKQAFAFELRGKFHEAIFGLGAGLFISFYHPRERYIFRYGKRYSRIYQTIW